MNSQAVHVAGESVPLAVLQYIGRAVASGPDALLDVLLELAADVTAGDACAVYLRDGDSDELVLRASRVRQGPGMKPARLRIGDGVAGWVAANRSAAAIVGKASTGPRLSPEESPPGQPVEAVLAVPLASGDEVLGVLSACYREPRQHSSETVALMSLAGEQFGAALQKERLIGRIQTASRRAAVLGAVAQALTTEDHLDRILQGVSDRVAEMFDSPLTCIVLMSEEKRELTISAARCTSPEYLHKTPVSLEQSVVEEAVREGRPVVIEAIEAEKERRFPELARRTGLASLVCVPLLSRGHALGAVNVYTPEPRSFSADEIEFLKAVASQAAVGIENARLTEETQEMKRALETRKLVERAKGILQQTHGLTEEEAYLRLRNESRRMRRPMRDLAEAIILAEDISRKSREEPSPEP